MNNSASLSTKRIVEEFIKKATLVILNSRIQSEKEDDAKSKINSSLLLDQKENEDLDDIFLEDYTELQSFRKLLNNYTIEIYFKRKEFKVLMEKWSFQYLQQLEDWDTDALIDEDFCKKKLAVMLRSVYSISRLLPAYSLFNKTGFNYCFEYRLFLSLKNQNQFSNVHTSKLKVANSDISNISISVEYINKSDVFQLEEEYHKKTLEYLILNRAKQRPRCFSLTNAFNNPLFEVLTFDSSENVIKEDYFSDKRKANDKLNLSIAPSQIKHANDISFQSETDNPSYHRYINTEPSPPDIEVNLSNDLCLRKCSMLSDTIDALSNSKTKALNPNQYNNSDSTAKKLMKTSDTSSEFESENSFELEIEDDVIEVKRDDKVIVNKDQVGERFVINNTTDDILTCYNKLKKALKSKTKLNAYKLCEVLHNVLDSKY